MNRRDTAMTRPTDKKTSLIRGLKPYRIRRQLTIEQMAAILSLSKSHYWRLENEQGSTSDRTAYRIEQALPGLLETNHATAKFA